jgi:hypothetical protein
MVPKTGLNKRHGIACQTTFGLTALSLTHTHTHTHIHPHRHTHRHTHTHSLTHSITHSLAHKPTPTHIHTYTAHCTLYYT